MCYLVIFLFLVDSITSSTEIAPARSRCPEPEYCRCDWKEHSVLCGNNITYIPEIPPDTRSLSMRRSNLGYIDSVTFTNLTNVRLTFLGLSYCGLKGISNDAFRKVEFQKNSSLSINGNAISVTDINGVICHLPRVNLTRVFIDRMPRMPKIIPPGSFECLANSSITYLSLSNNKLQTFSGDVFPPMSNLEYLRLDNNALVSVEPINLKSLMTLSIRSNILVKVPTFIDEHGESRCPLLKTLDLSQNALGRVDVQSSDFKGLRSLVDLILKHSTIERLNDDILTEMPRLKNFYLQKGNIQDISKNAFNSISLDHIDLSSNNLRFKHLSNWDIFTGCPNLRKLTLNNNYLNALTQSQFTKLFSPLKKLEELFLDYTRLEKIPDNLFESLTSLKKLFMSTNVITQWNSTIFSKARKLNTLYLDANRIAIINETSFPKALLQQLTYLNVGLNPFACTCDLLWFRSWMNRTNTTIVDLHSPNYYQCNFPAEWKNKALLEFRPTVDECTPLNLPVILGASLGSLAAIVIVVVVLMVRYRMHFRYLVFLIRSRMKQYKQLEDVNDYCYDAFVVYSAEDKDWVMNELMQRVEHREGYKLSVYDRDFTPGRDIVDSIMENMESSRMVIVVLSDNFAQSEWCKWELTMAQNKLLDGRKDILILVKLDDIHTEHLNNRLMLLMRDKVYIDWSNTDLGREMFWQRLISALARPLAPANA